MPESVDRIPNTVGSADDIGESFELAHETVLVQDRDFDIWMIWSLSPGQPSGCGEAAVAHLCDKVEIALSCSVSRRKCPDVPHETRVQMPLRLLQS